MMKAAGIVAGVLSLIAVGMFLGWLSRENEGEKDFYKSCTLDGWVMVRTYKGWACIPPPPSMSEILSKEEWK